jgi:hypothetical protein
MKITFDPSLRHVLLARHLPQESRPGQLPTDWWPEAPLKMPDAADIATRVRAAYLDGFDIMFGMHSLLDRTRESLNLLAPQAKKQRLAVNLGPSRYADWGFCANMKGASAQECFEYAPGLLRTEGEKVYGLVQHTASVQLEDGQVALLVSHAPLCESAIASAQDEWPPVLNFDKGGMGWFKFDGPKLVGCRYLPIPTA